VLEKAIHLWEPRTEKEETDSPQSSLRACPNVLRLPTRSHLLKLPPASGLAPWPMPIIPTTWEMEIGRTVVRGQLGQKVSETLSQPIKKWAWW
jgi:hypothetical protein